MEKNILNETPGLISDSQSAEMVDPTVSVVIPVREGGAKFRDCLTSLIDCRPAPAEIIVVLDGEREHDRRIAEEFRAKVFTLRKPKGPSAARNLGAQAAHGDIICFVDADVSVPADIFRQFSKAFTHDSELTAAFGSYDDAPFEKNFLSQYKNLLHHYVHQNANEKASTFWTGSGAIRREAFNQIGGFDEEFTCIEDIELGYRLRNAGYIIRVLKHIQVKHLKRWNVLSLLKTDFFCRALPWTDLILNEGSFPDEPSVNRSGRLSVISAYLILLLLCATFWYRWLLLPAALLIFGLIALNWDLFCFYYKKRGLLFTLKTVFWHWFYFFYSGLAFVIGLTKHTIRNLLPKKLSKSKM